jgi:hypothetical protein
MSDLKDYFSALSRYEHKPAAQVAAWNSSDVQAISDAFRAATAESRIKFAVHPDVSVQSLGNKVAAQFVRGMNNALQGYSLRDCPGKGYPDQRLEELNSGRLFAFELKAKTSFEKWDANRLVLTSASAKLRKHFPPGKPIGHLLATVLYTKIAQGRRCTVRIRGLRLDFLPPWSPVQMRLEASVSPRLLLRGNHQHRVFRTKRKLRGGAQKGSK